MSMSKYFTRIKQLYVLIACDQTHDLIVCARFVFSHFKNKLMKSQHQDDRGQSWQTACAHHAVSSCWFTFYPLWVCVSPDSLPAWWFAVSLHVAEMWRVNKECCCHPTADQTHIRWWEDDKQSKQNLISGAITSVCLIFGTCCRKPGPLTPLDSPLLAVLRIGIITH